MHMGQLLFHSPVDYNILKEHIGKATFKAHLPGEIKFPMGPNNLPEIPDNINDRVEGPRLRAVELMNQIAAQ